jgi:hypothetical protein
MDHESQINYVADPIPANLISIAQQTAVDNRTKRVGETFSIAQSDIRLGQWSNHTFTETLNHPNAVKVTVSKNANLNGPVTTFFANVFGIDSVASGAYAIAALTAQSIAPEGGIELPVGISKYWFNSSHWAPGNYCNQPIKFYPTGDLEGCAGWHTFDQNANASTLKQTIDGITDGTYDSPEIVAGIDSLEFIGGNIATAFSNMEDLFISRRGSPITDEYGNRIKIYYDPDTDFIIDPRDYPAGTDFSKYTPVTEKDGTQKDLYEWQTTVPVYDRTNCSNPTQNIQVVGFSTVIVMAVNGSQDDPKHRIFAKVLCDNVVPGRGGGAPFGTVASVPGLVE